MPEVFTYEYVARSLLQAEEQSVSREQECKTVHCAVAREFVLIDTLPPLSRLLQEAAQQAVITEEQQKLDQEMRDVLASALPTAEDDLFAPEPVPIASPPTAARRLSAILQRSRSSSTSSVTGKSTSAQPVKKRNWEAHDVYRAIERKDLTTIFEIRDAAFPLLVQKTGGQTPLLYASRIGKSHKEIAILLTGALSRFVNHLPDDASQITPELQALIRGVRTNLKLAINESISSNQTELVSSYLQIIIMSEGEKWIINQTQSVALAIRAGKTARPVQTAKSAVQAFATRELKMLEKANAVASVDDYLANATVDLTMMAMWSLVTDKVGGDPLPSYQFGRDDRICKSFAEGIKLASQKAEYDKKITKQLRMQINETLSVMNARATGHSEKMRALADIFDE